MKTKLVGVMVIAGLFSLSLGSVSFAQQNEKDNNAVIETAKNYIEGGYTADADRMHKALWPELYKAIPVTIPKSGITMLATNCHSQLIENVRMVKVDNTDKKINISVEVINEGMAAVKITSAQFNDFLHMAYMNGEWKIINILWTWGSDSQRRDKSLVFDPEKEKGAIEQAALDYIDGFFEGSADRMTKAVHPEINKVTFYVNPKSGKGWFSKMGSSMLIGYTAAKAGLMDKEKRNINVKILDVMDGLASVEILSATLYDYLHLAKINGQWKIINVLWKPKPAPVK